MAERYESPPGQYIFLDIPSTSNTNGYGYQVSLDQVYNNVIACKLLGFKIIGLPTGSPYTYVFLDMQADGNTAFNSHVAKVNASGGQVSRYVPLFTDAAPNTDTVYFKVPVWLINCIQTGDRQVHNFGVRLLDPTGAPATFTQLLLFMEVTTRVPRIVGQTII
jgi:hypothetical protein